MAHCGSTFESHLVVWFPILKFRRLVLRLQPNQVSHSQIKLDTLSCNHLWAGAQSQRLQLVSKCPDGCAIGFVILLCHFKAGRQFVCIGLQSRTRPVGV